MGLFSDPFRPLFLLAALLAALVVPLWVAVAGGLLAPPVDDPLAWHIHEMLFGYTGAVIAGFLFTAIPNWTGRLPLRGPGLVALVLLWLAGRVVMVLPLAPIVAGLADGAFLVIVAALAWREVAAGRNWRNAPVCLMVTLFAAANLAFHAPDLREIAIRLGFGVVALLIGLIGGRIVPSFTRNWLAKRDDATLPVPFGRYDKLALLVLAVALLAWIVAPAWLPTGVLLLGAAALHAVRLVRWRGWSTTAEPLVLVMHLGYLWLVVALVLLGLHGAMPAAVEASAALHALSAGAIGTMTLAVMTRASLGHGGHALHAGTGTVAIYLLVTVGGLLRVAAPLLPVPYMDTIWLAAAAWSGAFALFVVVYGPLLARPRERAASV